MAEPLRFVSVRPPADGSFVTGPGATLCRPESGARRAGRVGRAMALVQRSGARAVRRRRQRPPVPKSSLVPDFLPTLCMKSGSGLKNCTKIRGNMADFVLSVLLIALFGLVVLFVAAYSWAQWWLKPFLTKQAEKLATKEELSEVLRQTQATTRAVESVKSEIAHGLWERQTILTLKREVYRDLFSALGDYEFSLHEMQGWGQLSASSDPTVQSFRMEKLKAAQIQSSDAQRRLFQLSGPIRLLVSGEAAEALATHFAEIRALQPDDLAAATLAIAKLRSKLVAAGKKDLGIGDS